MKTDGIGILSLVALFLACCVKASTRLETETKFVENILDPENYNPSVRPFELSNASGPIHVTVNTYIRGIYDLDDLKKEFSVQLTFRQSWKDSRLSYPNSNETKYVTIKNTASVWTPDTFFSNEKTGHFHNIMTPNVLIRIQPDGQILYSARISMKLSCPMDLKYFPMDNQVCNVIMASYAYSTDDLVYLWKEGDPVQVTRNLNIPHFTLENFYVDYCTSKTITGEYSCIKISLLFRREFNHYFLQIYLPSIILVVTSWICFWVDPKKITARIFLWMATFFAFSMQLASFSKKLPDVGYRTVYDTWITTCILFLAAVILETGFITLFFSRGNRKNPTDNTFEEENDLKKHDSSEDTQPQRYNAVLRVYHILLRTYRSPEQKVDLLCRILFPLAFVLFNLFYWCCTVKKND